ncbi:hypothetical protein B0T26DRAFT_677062 [Lasiosphaeria miniovina]|uniref:Uncharacterized protein n=1 Tax=Lasiosphaeria miniovina TaxID=1954250 RepID=A0AA40DQQ7_9PEZI|nr:uncharacterized protein B0T26DRAFT_677062 [Lasiosphaeria miniovina]KAK0712624.1 hypothetical protein B0T26DRAFT_677062 [Lasiosphaeria miniovina]
MVHKLGTMMLGNSATVACGLESNPKYSRSFGELPKDKVSNGYLSVFSAGPLAFQSIFLNEDNTLGSMELNNGFLVSFDVTNFMEPCLIGEVVHLEPMSPKVDHCVYVSSEPSWEGRRPKTPWNDGQVSATTSRWLTMFILVEYRKSEMGLSSGPTVTADADVEPRMGGNAEGHN